MKSQEQIQADYLPKKAAQRAAQARRRAYIQGLEVAEEKERRESLRRKGPKVRVIIDGYPTWLPL